MRCAGLFTQASLRNLKKPILGKLADSFFYLLSTASGATIIVVKVILVVKKRTAMRLRR